MLRDESSSHNMFPMDDMNTMIKFCGNGLQPSALVNVFGSECAGVWVMWYEVFLRGKGCRDCAGVQGITIWLGGCSVQERESSD